MTHAAAELHEVLVKRISRGHTTHRDVGLLNELLGCSRRSWFAAGFVLGLLSCGLGILAAAIANGVDPLWLALGGVYAIGVLWLSIPKAD
jgi:hypothetical protein